MANPTQFFAALLKASETGNFGRFKYHMNDIRVTYIEDFQSAGKLDGTRWTSAVATSRGVSGNLNVVHDVGGTFTYDELVFDEFGVPTIIKRSYIDEIYNGTSTTPSDDSWLGWKPHLAVYKSGGAASDNLTQDGTGPYYDQVGYWGSSIGGDTYTAFLTRLLEVLGWKFDYTQSPGSPSFARVAGRWPVSDSSISVYNEFSSAGYARTDRIVFSNSNNLFYTIEWEYASASSTEATLIFSAFPPSGPVTQWKWRYSLPSRSAALGNYMIRNPNFSFSFGGLINGATLISTPSSPPGFSVTANNSGVTILYGGGGVIQGSFLPIIMGYTGQPSLFDGTCRWGYYSSEIIADSISLGSGWKVGRI